MSLENWFSLSSTNARARLVACLIKVFAFRRSQFHFTLFIKEAKSLITLRMRRQVFGIAIFCDKLPFLKVNEPQREKTYLLTYAPNEDSNQPAHPRSLIRVFVVRMNKLCILGYPKRAQWRFWSDCANAQADLNLRKANMSDCTFLVDAARMITCRLVEPTRFSYLFLIRILLTGSSTCICNLLEGMLIHKHASV